MDANQMRAAISELQAEVRRQREEITTQRDEIDALQTPVLLPQRPRQSLPEPDKFGGSAYKFDTWLPAIKAKIRVDGPAIGDATAQFYYVYLNLESTIQAMVLPQLSRAEELASHDYRTILDQLTRVYDNPNKVQEAEDKLYTIKQAADSLPVYVAKFERTLYEAHGQEWADVNKISAFRNGLSGTLRNRLAQQLSLPRTYTEFVRVVQQLAGRSSATPFTSSGHGPGSHHHGSPTPMDLSSLEMKSFDTYPQRSYSPPSSGRARSFSPRQRDYLRFQGLCVRCGSNDHWVNLCHLEPHSPRARPSSPPANRSACSSGKKVTIAALYDDNDNDNKPALRPKPRTQAWYNSHRVKDFDLADLEADEDCDITDFGTDALGVPIRMDTLV